MHKVNIGRKSIPIPSGIGDLSGHLLKSFAMVAFLPDSVFSPQPENAAFFRQLAFLQLGFAGYQKHFSRLNDLQFIQVVGLLEWINQPLPAQPLLNEIRLGKKRCIAPESNLQNSTLLEYAMADGCFSLLEERPELLNKLIAVLYRPANDTRPDGREKLNTKSVSENTALAAMLPAYQKQAVLRFFIASKLAIHKAYDCWEESLSEGETGNKGGVNWAENMLSIAETGIFGNLEQVKEANVHEVFLYLQKSKRQTAELKRVYGKHK